MVKEQLIEKSPLRKLDQSTHGGVGIGNIGVIASAQGVGKTACLVHIATDKLMNDKHVIHISYSNRVDHIISWYEDIFKEIAKKRELENVLEVHDDLVKNRVIMNFNQKGVAVNHVLESVKAMISQGHFNTDALIVDGFDFNHATKEDVQAFKTFAETAGIEIWFSDNYEKELQKDEKGFPQNIVDFHEFFSIVISLMAEKDYIHLHLLKDHDKLLDEDLPLKLDPQSLLIADV